MSTIRYSILLICLAFSTYTFAEDVKILPVLPSLDEIEVIQKNWKQSKNDLIEKLNKAQAMVDSAVNRLLATAASLEQKGKQNSGEFYRAAAREYATNFDRNANLSISRKFLESGFEGFMRIAGTRAKDVADYETRQQQASQGEIIPEYNIQHHPIGIRRAYRESLRDFNETYKDAMWLLDGDITAEQFVSQATKSGISLADFASSPKSNRVTLEIRPANQSVRLSHEHPELFPFLFASMQSDGSKEPFVPAVGGRSISPALNIFDDVSKISAMLDGPNGRPLVVRIKRPTLFGSKGVRLNKKNHRLVITPGSWNKDNSLDESVSRLFSSANNNKYNLSGFPSPEACAIELARLIK